jgi:hypothetical protein
MCLLDLKFFSPFRHKQSELRRTGGVKVFLNLTKEKLVDLLVTENLLTHFVKNKFLTIWLDKITPDRLEYDFPLLEELIQQFTKTTESSNELNSQSSLLGSFFVLL